MRAPFSVIGNGAFGETFVRNGKPLVDGAPLAPVGNGNFRVGTDEWSPERLSFGAVINGRCPRLKFSGVEFYRTFTP